MVPIINWVELIFTLSQTPSIVGHSSGSQYKPSNRHLKYQHFYLFLQSCNSQSQVVDLRHLYRHLYFSFDLVSKTANSNVCNA